MKNATRSFTSTERRQIAERDPVYRSNKAALDAKFARPSWTWHCGIDTYHQTARWLEAQAVRRFIHSDLGRVDYQLRTGGNFNNISESMNRRVA